MQTRLDTTPRATLAAALLLILSACGGGGSADTGTTTAAAATTAAAPTAQTEAVRPAPAPPPPPATPAAVGERLFHDTALSANGRQSCASCHTAAQALADAAGSFLPLGGVNGDRQGLRSSPSLRYLDNLGPFRIDAQGNAQGGLFWDGRADNRQAQALGPLFNANEMANTDTASLARKLRALPYAADLLSSARLNSAASDEQLMQALTQALAAYQAQDTGFHPFTSKFDAVQDGRASFTAQEARGLAAFNDPRRGNCASCHSSTPPPGGLRALFSNHRYFALGVPRNTSRATADPGFFDLGLCGPQRSDLATQAQLCGQFRVPSLRNVAVTAPYFHNARFNTLDEVVAFYATRDTDPARWYPVVNGQVQAYNDLPARYQANVHRGPPFNRRPGQAPAFNAQDGADIVAFLRTLSDGFDAGTGVVR